MDEEGWILFEGADSAPHRAGGSVPVPSEGKLAALRKDCLHLGYGGFVVKRGVATLRPLGRAFLLEHKTTTWLDRGSMLYVAPESSGAESLTASSREVLLKCATSRVYADPEQLAANSGYFASVFRHSWADAEECHTFSEFPGGEAAFALATAWLVAHPGSPVGEPWPIQDRHDVCILIKAATYLDSPQLLRAAVRSWSLFEERGTEDRLLVAGAISEASLQFEGPGQDLVISALLMLLQDLPKHQLALAPEFLAAPAAGLTVLEAKESARETIIGAMRSVGGMVASVISGSGGERSVPNEDPDSPLSPNDFAVRLFDQHEAFFIQQPPVLRRLLRHIDASVPIVAPLCYRLAAAAVDPAMVAEDPSFHSLGIDIFERSISSARCPAEAAADPACVEGLFGAGGRRPADGVVGLEVLARPVVPPAAAGVILSRVLSSWAAAESSAGADAAAVILAGVASDRQRLRILLEAVLPRIADEGGAETGNDWGSNFDYAVPELRAALVHALTTRAELDHTVRLLFRVLFQPTGGLPGINFPLSLLEELRGHSHTCLALAVRCAVGRLRDLFAEAPGSAWRSAEEAWPWISWGAATEELLEDVVAMLRDWMAFTVSASSATEGKGKGSAGGSPEAAMIRLLLQLPLERLPRPEVLLGPPVPAHVLATLAFRATGSLTAKIARLEEENQALHAEIERLSVECRKHS